MLLASLASWQLGSTAASRRSESLEEPMVSPYRPFQPHSDASLDRPYRNRRPVTSAGALARAREGGCGMRYVRGLRAVIGSGRLSIALSIGLLLFLIGGSASGRALDGTHILTINYTSNATWTLAGS